MTAVRTSYQVQRVTQTLHKNGTLGVSAQRLGRGKSVARTILRRLVTHVVNGSDHACWRG